MKKDIRFKILMLLNIVAVIPKSALAVIDNGGYIYKVLTDLVKKDILQLFKTKNCGERNSCYVFKDYNSFFRENEHIIDAPQAYKKYYQQYGREAVRICKKRPGWESLKVITNAEVLIMMHFAGVDCVPGSKPDLNTKFDYFETNKNIYYTSIEVKRASGYVDNYYDEKKVNTDFLCYRAKKGLKGEEKTINSSRISGMLICGTKPYMVYKLKNPRTKLTSINESKIRIYIWQKICGRIHGFPDSNRAIVIVDDYMEIAPLMTRMICSDVNKKTQFDFFCELMRSAIYALPYNIVGRRMIEIMQSDDWEEKMREKCLKKYNYQRNQSEYRNKIDISWWNGRKILLFCIPEIYKMRLTIAALEAGDKKEITIVCFDWQQELIETTCGNIAEIEVVDFDSIYNGWT